LGFTDLDGLESISEPVALEPESRYSVEEIHYAIQQLPEGSRVVLSLHLLEGYQHQEISQILGISVSTSKSQYHRAKKLLRNILLKSKNQKYA
jgi:RNA polymerase sigma-70 factor (ECF subfamily)